MLMKNSLSQRPAEFKEFLDILNDVNDLKMASNVLHWDQNTHMPQNGFTMRGRQLSTLGKLAHEKFTDKRIGQLLDKLQPFEKSLPVNSFEASLIRVTRRDYEKSLKLKSQLVAEILSHQSTCYEKWIQAKSESDFSIVAPYLEKTLDLSRQYASSFEYKNIADPLIQESDEGFNAQNIKELFTELKQKLVPLVRQVTENFKADDSFLKEHFPIETQANFGRFVIEQLGYDFNRGRIDTTHHPFMISFAHGDVRITTRYNTNDFCDGIFSLIHETGHAFYEMGIGAELDGTALFSGTSSGVHESQSRLWENIVGRSKDFWHYFYPKLKEYFPVFNKIPLDAFYRAINKVSPSLIRTDADELTYNLHVCIRFDLELALLEGKLSIKDLPDAWNSSYAETLGVSPKNDAEGCLQDVHWYASFIGGQFQGYTIGNIMSAQFFNSALKVLPNLKNDFAKGQFAPLKNWLAQTIHTFGKKMLPHEVLQFSTGENLQISHYMDYLSQKFLPMC